MGVTQATLNLTDDLEDARALAKLWSEVSARWQRSWERLVGELGGLINEARARPEGSRSATVVELDDLLTRQATMGLVGPCSDPAKLVEPPTYPEVGSLGWWRERFETHAQIGRTIIRDALREIGAEVPDVPTVEGLAAIIREDVMGLEAVAKLLVALVRRPPFRVGVPVVWHRLEGDMLATIIGHSPRRQMPWFVRFEDGQWPVWVGADELMHRRPEHRMLNLPLDRHPRVSCAAALEGREDCAAPPRASCSGTRTTPYGDVCFFFGQRVGPLLSQLPYDEEPAQ